MKKHPDTRSALLVPILTLGVFGIIDTEMGVVGIIPQIARTFGVTIPEAGWTVSVFALIVACSAPVLPMLLSGFERRRMMLVTLGLFTLSNVVAALTDRFGILLAARALPAFLHPVYVSMAFTVAAQSVREEEAPKAVSRVFVGVSAGMVLGVPVTSFIAQHASFAAAMWFFAAINASVFLATLTCIPPLPVRERLSYGTQLQVLKKPLLWYSFLAFTLINGAMFGFFSFMSDFLGTVTGLPSDTVSALLLVYGSANVAGNLLAGRLFVRHRRLYMAFTPPVMLAAYLLLFATGTVGPAAAALVLVLGLLAGFVNIVGQYMIADAAAEAPDFANGLFLTAANLGTTVGTALCGGFIAGFGTRYSLLATALFLIMSLGFVAARIRSARRPAASNPSS